MNEWIFNNKNEQNTEVTTPKLQVVTKISKWNKYDCVTIDNIKYIRGYSTNSNSELFSFTTIKSPIVLFALMELANNIQTQTRHLHKDINDNIVDTDIELILKFCRTYGLPFWNKGYTGNITLNDTPTPKNDIARTTMFRPIIPFANQNMFPIASFIVGLKLLQNDFLRVVAWNEWQNDINICGLISNVPRKVIEHHIKNNSDLYTPNLNPFVTYWDNKNFCLALNCENLIHLSIYYLCIISQSNDYTGGFIRKCEKCGKLFITPQSRQKYCYAPCTRQANYQAKQRLNKRG